MLSEIILATGEVVKVSDLAAEGAWPEGNPSYDGEPGRPDAVAVDLAARRAARIARQVRQVARMIGEATR